MRDKVLAAFILCCCLLFTGCAATISREGYVRDPSAAGNTDCSHMIVVKGLNYDARLVDVVGRISADDYGLSTKCSERYVIDIFKKDACTAGADIINIVKESQPDWLSECYRARAEFLRIKDRKKLDGYKSDPRYATQKVAERSRYTECVNEDVVEVGVLGGFIGGLMLDDVCKRQSESR